MMGTSHALTGAAAWVAVTSTAAQLPAFGWHPLEPAAVALGAVVCAGAALLPDADHHNATIPHSVPGAAKLATAAVGALSGGHRHGTHSGISAVAVLLGALWLTSSGWLDIDNGVAFTVVAGAVAAALLAFAVKVLRITKRWPLAWAVGVTLASIITWLAPGQWSWLPLCVAIGWIVHLAGDFLTTGGLPLAWPLKPKAPRALAQTPLLGSLWTRGGYFALPALGNAGSWREWLLMVPVAVYAFAGIALAGAAALPTVFG
ncbi:metal-dependent hydrolase [Rathayibacter rathayi]|uniref:Hydrolase n=1 Tax=Rathayibacter rathayi TaxID=33887 RepID=A0ABX5AGW3_RATRA|nr:metal-dependent hydrolase [Rathayibacter rathayi]PPF24259.1 hydrolase [Rathayibacter rathayi]PPF51580.1 hydrolase [Rathayibacter rathayi]PPF83171.1 hydrolase [Rathayibacter rathayi]PPG47001.1 hydrolase [Rathayibacter rathayi]PPG96537.1 hydrolase [Rathayibacter rathayi]